MYFCGIFRSYWILLGSPSPDHRCCEPVVGKTALDVRPGFTEEARFPYFSNMGEDPTVFQCIILYDIV